MIVILVITSLFRSDNVVSAQHGIVFENVSIDSALIKTYKPINFQKILEKSKKENKIVFIDCYTNWCSSCNWMVKNVFVNDTVGDFFNSNFICIKIDMDKADGEEIEKLYEINCFPTFLFIDSDGKLLHRKSGRYSVSEFIGIGCEAITPEKRFSFLKDKYESNQIGLEELMSYIKLRQYSCLGVEEEITKYFALQPESEYTEETNWSLIRDFELETSSFMFKFFVSHREVFYPLFTRDSVDNVIADSYLREIRQCFWGKKIDTAKYEKLKLEVLNLNLPFSKRLVSECEIRFYERTGDWKKYANAVICYIELYLPKDEEEYEILNDFAWMFYEHIDAGIYLDLAIGWIKRAIEIEQTSTNTNTFAHLLYKRGKKDEAEIMALKSIEIAKQEGIDYRETVEFLEEIKAMK